MSLLQLKAEMDDIDERMESLKNEKTDCRARIDVAIADSIKQLRAIQGKDYGTVTALIDGITVKHTITPKITWDQEKLCELFERISNSGERPGDYMKMTLTVPETNYKNFSPEIRAHFDAARSIEQGAVKVEFCETTGGK